MVGKTRTVDSLLEEYDAVFVGSGAGLPWFMEIPGENLNGVYSANEYLTRMNLMKGFLFPKYHTPIKNHKCVAVLGRRQRRHGLRAHGAPAGSRIRIIYRRSRTELPGAAGGG